MEGRHVHVWENTYIMEPEHHEKFLPSKVTAIIHRVLTDRLKEKEYDANEAKIWCIDLANDIKSAVKDECNMPRYKIICQVVVGKNDGQGIRVASKCLWDNNNDNWASGHFKNQALFAIGMVFGCYYE